MFASLSMLLIIALMLLPGIVMGNLATTLAPRSLLRIFGLQTLLFIGLGLVFKILPWLIDPRFSLW